MDCRLNTVSRDVDNQTKKRKNVVFVTETGVNRKIALHRKLGYSEDEVYINDKNTDFLALSRCMA